MDKNFQKLAEAVGKVLAKRWMIQKTEARSPTKSDESAARTNKSRNKKVQTRSPSINL